MININKLILVYSLIISILAIVFYLSYRTQLSNASLANINLKAFNSELDSSKQKNIIHELTISQLQYYNDSLNTKLFEITKELHIKNSKLKSYGYIQSKIVIKDTIAFKDTIFVPNLNLDTLLKDSIWYSLSIKCKYPDTLLVTPKFKSKCWVILSTRKETVEPPKKFFLLRWFQKRHTIVEANVFEESPYIITEKSRFVEIIK